MNTHTHILDVNLLGCSWRSLGALFPVPGKGLSVGVLRSFCRHSSCLRAVFLHFRNQLQLEQHKTCEDRKGLTLERMEALGAKVI